jgi:hypothetical protein
VSDKPTVTSSEVELLELILSTGEWLNAKEIAIHWRWQDAYPQGDKSRETYLAGSIRKIRAIANASGGSVLSGPGTDGYKLRLAATDEEVARTVAKLRHQSAEMHARATAIERYGQPDEQMELRTLGAYMSKAV